MPSPDFSRYIDLTVFDDDARSALSDILGTARGLLPTWRAEAGQIETVLAEAIAVRSAELSAAINRLPGSTTETLLKLFGITRDDGVRATGNISITFSDSNTVTRSLPAGTKFLYYSAVNGQSFTFELIDDFVLSGALTGTAPVQAAAVGEQYNLSASGQSLVALTSSTFFVSASFSGNTAGGRREETDNEFFDRAINTLASYTSASVTPEQIRAYITSTKPYANRVAVYDQRRYRDRDTTSDTYTTHPGYVLVAAAGTMSDVSTVVSDMTVSASNLADLNTSLASRIPSGITVDIMTCEIAEVDVSVSLKIKSGFVASAVTAVVTAAIQEYLNPNNWDFSNQRVRVNEIISLVDSIEGVDYVSQVLLNGDSLLGTDVIGYFGSSGGTAASANINISGASGSTVPAGSTYYFVDVSNLSAPEVLTYSLNSNVTLTAGAGSGIVTAVDNGTKYNDLNNGGKVSSATLTGTDTDFGTATLSGDLTGGTDDSQQYTAFPAASSVATDAVFKDLGTLPVYGTVTVTVI